MTPLVKPSPLFFLSLLLIFSLPELSGQPKILERPSNQPLADGVPLPSPTRHSIDLSGTWTYALDDENWKEVSLPASFDHEGKITFQRKFTVEQSLLESSHFKVMAMGINNEAEILINDVFVGRHFGGYASFEIDIPEGILQFGSENTIKVVVNNVLTASTTLPVRKQVWGWRNYGGILREIFILSTPKLWINRLALQTKYHVSRHQGEIDYSATISTANFDLASDSMIIPSKSSPFFALQFDLFDLQSDVPVGSSPPQQFDLRVNQDVEVRSSVAVNNPKLWSPETPELYRLKASLLHIDGKKRMVIDEFHQLIGFRNIEIIKDQIHVNGKRVNLRGIVWHEDSPEYGASLSYAEMERDVVLIKMLGANAIRFAFHPPHPYMVTLCSRYGLFALMELPVWNVPAQVLSQENFQNLAESFARDMIVRDQHHPSVLAWGLGSEFDSSDPRSRTYVQRLVSAMRLLDRRPVFYGSKMLQNDQCADLVDFTAFIPSAADLKSFKLSLTGWKKQYPDKPVVVLQYGRVVDHNNRNGYSDPLSQEAQARFFIQYYEAIRQAGVAGSFISSFADWLGDRPILTVKSDKPYLHSSGLVNEAREKRLAFEVVKTIYADQKVAALSVGNHRGSLPVAHVIAGFSVIFVLAYQYNYNRRFREALKRSLLRPYNFFADLRDLRATSFLHTLLLSLAISVTLGVVVSSMLYYFRDNTFADLVLTQLVPSDRIKEELISLTWNPVEGIFVLSGIFFGFFFLFAFLLKLTSFVTRARVSLMHTFSITVWGASPLIFLSPMGMSLFKVLENPIYIIPSFVVLAIFGVWVTIRLLRGISVLFDISAAKAYGVGAFVIVATKILVFLLLDTEYSLVAYLEFLMNIARYAG